MEAPPSGPRKVDPAHEPLIPPPHEPTSWATVGGGPAAALSFGDAPGYLCAPPLFVRDIGPDFVFMDVINEAATRSRSVCCGCGNTWVRASVGVVRCVRTGCTRVYCATRERRKGRLQQCSAMRQQMLCHCAQVALGLECHCQGCRKRRSRAWTREQQCADPKRRRRLQQLTRAAPGSSALWAPGSARPTTYHSQQMAPGAAVPEAATLLAGAWPGPEDAASADRVARLPRPPTLSFFRDGHAPGATYELAPYERYSGLVVPPAAATGAGATPAIAGAPPCLVSVASTSTGSMSDLTETTVGAAAVEGAAAANAGLSSEDVEAADVGLASPVSTSSSSSSSAAAAACALPLPALVQVPQRDGSSLRRLLHCAKQRLGIPDDAAVRATVLTGAVLDEHGRFSLVPAAETIQVLVRELRTLSTPDPLATSLDGARDAADCA